MNVRKSLEYQSMKSLYAIFMWAGILSFLCRGLNFSSISLPQRFFSFFHSTSKANQIWKINFYSEKNGLFSHYAMFISLRLVLVGEAGEKGNIFGIYTVSWSHHDLENFPPGSFNMYEKQEIWIVTIKKLVLNEEKEEDVKESRGQRWNMEWSEHHMINIIHEIWYISTKKIVQIFNV